MLIVVKKQRYVGRFMSENIQWWLCLKHVVTMSGITVCIAL